MRTTLKRFVVTILILSLFSAFFSASAAYSDTTVYITKTGEKYHLDGCQYLSKSQIPIALADAIDQGYGACKRCCPPTSYESRQEPSYEQPSQQESISDEPAYAAPPESESPPGWTQIPLVNSSQIYTKQDLEDAQEVVRQSLKEYYDGVISRLERERDEALSIAREEADKELQDKLESLEHLDAFKEVNGKLTSENRQLLDRIDDLENEARQANNDPEINWLASLIISAITALVTAFLVSVKKEQEISILSNANAKQAIELQECRESVQKLKQSSIIAQLSGKSCRDLANVPKDASFNANGYLIGRGKESYLVKLNTKSGTYHRPTCRYATGPVEDRNVLYLKEGKPCSSCKPPVQITVPDWAIEYRRLLQEKKTLGIPDPDLPLLELASPF